MSREVIFTMKEGTRYGVIKGLLEGRMTNTEASRCLGLSCRQIQRIKKRVQTEGAEGVIHGNKGRRPSGSFPDVLRKKVIELAQNKYRKFNFSHLSEWLAEKESIAVSRETLRKWLRSEGLGKKLKKIKKHRQRRQRSEYEGQMLFLDGSPHRWFGDTKTTLILATDDATGAPLWGTFRANEDLDGCFIVCKEVFKRYGLPTCFYLDKASQFTTTRHKGAHVQQDDTEQTQFERAMEELSVGLIFANSPQARGRGERINSSLQDRLVAELSFYAIKTREDAENYLNKIFIPQYARRFQVKPKGGAWRTAAVNLNNILCKRFARTVINDNTISVEKIILQLEPSHGRSHFVRARVTVNKWTDGTYHVYHPTLGELKATALSNGSCQPQKRVRSEPLNCSRPVSEAKALPLKYGNKPHLAASSF